MSGKLSQWRERSNQTTPVSLGIQGQTRLRNGGDISDFGLGILNRINPKSAIQNPNRPIL
jgi:hypothetical protein